MNILILIAGLALILVGAQLLVDGSVSIAKRYGMSEFLIGITIVGIGTSMPEMVTSLVGALNGSGEIAIGNVTGSNMANVFLILGITALIAPIPIEKSTLKVDLPLNIIISVILLLMCFGFRFWADPAQGVITRWEAGLLLAIFIGYMIYSFRTSKKSQPEQPEPVADEKPKRKIPVWAAVAMIAVGLAGLIFGGRFFVNGAVGIARTLGLSESVIAITILALGTSMPELATSVVAAFKKNTQLALGNVIGSNIANLTLILGVCGIVRPLQTGNIAPTDIYVVILGGVLLLLSTFTFKKRTLDRPEGVIFLIIYFVYIYAISTNLIS